MNTHTSLCAWIFTDATLASNPYPNFQGALLYTNLQRFIARFLVLESIIQRLERLLYKAFDQSNSSCYTLSAIHPISKTEGLLAVES